MFSPPTLPCFELLLCVWTFRWFESLTSFGGTEKLLLVLRDGRKLIGVLRSWDQYGMLHAHCLTSEQGKMWRKWRLILWAIANLVLQDTVERIYTRDVYADIRRGIYLVRGENVLMLGEIVRTQYRPPSSPTNTLFH